MVQDLDDLTTETPTITGIEVSVYTIIYSGTSDEGSSDEGSSENLRTRDTMGPMILSLVERSSLARRSNNTLKY